MAETILGQSAPDIQFSSTSPHVKRFSELRGEALVIYFYPKDNTSGCTCEAENFRDCYSDFQKHRVNILGISRDSLSSHQKFKEKLNLPFDLISDKEEILCQWFQVIKDKKMYGKSVRGIERSTFLIDAEGILQRQWRGVKVPGHVAEVLSAIVAKAGSD
jgi:peroxiredoxin Q/BCP